MHLRAEGVEQRAERLAFQRHPVPPHLPVQPERLIGIRARRAGCTRLTHAHFRHAGPEHTCWESHFLRCFCAVLWHHILVADDVIRVPM